MLRFIYFLIHDPRLTSWPDARADAIRSFLGIACVSSRGPPSLTAADRRQRTRPLCGSDVGVDPMKMDEPAAACQRSGRGGEWRLFCSAWVGLHVIVRRLVSLIGTLRSCICGLHYSRRHNLALRVLHNLSPKKRCVNECKSVVGGGLY